MTPKTAINPSELTEKDFQSMWNSSAQKSSILGENLQGLNFSYSENVSKYNEIFSLNVVYGNTDLMYFRARYYSGELGRFVSRDPLGTALDVNMMNALNMLIAGANYSDGMSLYRAYFTVNGVDPSGMLSCIDKHAQLLAIEAQIIAKGVLIASKIVAIGLATVALAAHTAAKVLTTTAKEAANAALQACIGMQSADPCLDCSPLQSAYNAAVAADDAIQDLINDTLQEIGTLGQQIINLGSEISDLTTEHQNLANQECDFFAF